ncbi:MAG: GDP-mannose 4,6-dehydratase [Candidatus Levybacteria bacterium RIFCSPHIGHO2_12_FULL_38_12]|nr:MAG: GDP-mannose 4,6-dehydratase [Candidatus Levybacteria bacterium RIFCSPHIGHO2_01_FULL_38_12]OGH21742.1 MAG: GDP-mannose 4,6-dehydratase [Candidatus Levybacteria bacterium RIFCSPHIGHO2_02_FULL_37_18]OGH22600.1 MAG: GDP-mannose 4,6-dehydratase [Candidatus Levybacteria bacterium RIFCSPHIGHO2_12_FULL_38_12]OGH33363.1 MAG: GDP-mannose 4,6-dehydratase [Candidatus Levybacteria bacterium RIFCSPLOWO2_01_FULL_37_20]
MFKKVLITGIMGFVGSHLADYILKEHNNTKIYGLTRWRSPKDNVLKIIDYINLCYGDLEDYSSLEKILSTVKPDVIFHLAAQSYVDFSFVSPISTLQTNVVGTANLLEAIKTLKLQEKYDPIIHICSSSEVYGQVKEDEIPIKETNPFRPASPYAVSKVGEDMLALQYFLSWGIKTIRTRMFTHEGPRRGEVFAPSNFAKQIAAIEAGKQKPVVAVGNLNSVRTFMDVRDAVRAYWLLVNKCTQGEVYNIGGVETMTIGDMLNKLIRFSKRKNIKIEADPKRLRPSDVTLQIPSVEKFVRQTGWKPKIKFDQTLKDMLNYWRNYYKKNL